MVFWMAEYEIAETVIGYVIKDNPRIMLQIMQKGAFKILYVVENPQ